MNLEKLTTELLWKLDSEQISFESLYKYPHIPCSNADHTETVPVLEGESVVAILVKQGNRWTVDSVYCTECVRNESCIELPHKTSAVIEALVEPLFSESSTYVFKNAYIWDVNTHLSSKSAPNSIDSVSVS